LSELTEKYLISTIVDVMVHKLFAAISKTDALTAAEKVKYVATK
jgi:hypothetical protein